MKRTLFAARLAVLIAALLGVPVEAGFSLPPVASPVALPNGGLEVGRLEFHFVGPAITEVADPLCIVYGGAGMDVQHSHGFDVPAKLQARPVYGGRITTILQPGGSSCIAVYQSTPSGLNVVHRGFEGAWTTNTHLPPGHYALRAASPLSYDVSLVLQLYQA